MHTKTIIISCPVLIFFSSKTKTYDQVTFNGCTNCLVISPNLSNPNTKINDLNSKWAFTFTCAHEILLDLWTWHNLKAHFTCFMYMQYLVIQEYSKSLDGLQKMIWTDWLVQASLMQRLALMQINYPNYDLRSNARSTYHQKLLLTFCSFSPKVIWVKGGCLHTHFQPCTVIFI